MSLTGLLCALLLSLVASTSTAAAFSPDGPRATGLPLIEVIGCRMINGNLVCDRSGTLLPNRLRRPKATVKPQKKTVRPVQRKSPSKKSNTARQAPPQNDEDVDTAADAESEDEAEDSGEITCPPGWVPLDEPDEKGAVCEPESERSVTAPADSEPPSSAENGDAPSFKPAPEDAAEPDYIFETAPPGPEGSAAPSPSLAPAGQQPSAPTPPPNLESDKTPAETGYATKPANAPADAGAAPEPETGVAKPEADTNKDGSPSALAADDPTRAAFDAAKELGTSAAWKAFLVSYPEGFYADLARAYLEKLDPAAAPNDKPAADKPDDAGVPALEESPSPKPDVAGPAATEADEVAPADSSGGGDLVSGRANEPAVARGGDFMGFPEKFNRYYTDPTWKPSKTVYVSPDGSGDGTGAATPMSVRDAVAAARPGTQIYFLRGKYTGCFEFTKENSGTYDEPIVLYGERNEDGSIGVSMSCCTEGRQTCFNFEGADYVAVDGFELIGGKYGVRAVGIGYAASEHSRGIAVLDCNGQDQSRDPFFTGQSDWAVFERNVASGAKEEDGHGIYLSNGSDWNIVRFNETFSNVSSDFQINADPDSTCKEPGIPFNDPRCDAFAGEGEGGQGASDYFLVDGNYFHSSDVGPNFTSVRRSVVRNNVFGPQVRHNVSFWQETDNPKLGSSGNKIINNLFLTTGAHGVQFNNNSTDNEFANNVLLGINMAGDGATANPSAVLMEVDDTVGTNVYRSNFYVSGKIEGRTPADQETAREDFSASWFAKFPTALSHDANDFTPTAEAPFLDMGEASPDAPADRNGKKRGEKVDLGPIEGP